jgi:hypothetical protein
MEWILVIGLAAAWWLLYPLGQIVAELKAIQAQLREMTKGMQVIDNHLSVIQIDTDRLAKQKQPPVQAVPQTAVAQQ